MSVRLGAFAAGLIVVFGAAFGLGRTVGPVDRPPASTSVPTTGPAPQHQHGGAGS